MHQLHGRTSFPPTWAINLPSLCVNRPIQWYCTNRHDRNILCLSNHASSIAHFEISMHVLLIGKEGNVLPSTAF